MDTTHTLHIEPHDSECPRCVQLDNLAKQEQGQAKPVRVDKDDAFLGWILDIAESVAKDGA